MKDFQYLSQRIGANAINLRYTPIIVNEKYTVDYHIKTFKWLLENLDGYTNLVTFGFIDLYDKIKKNHPELKDCSDNDKILIAKEFQKIALAHHMSLRLCSKEKWLKDYGIDVEGCMRIEDYEKAIGKKLDIKQKMQARKGYCTCYLSNDIGSYNSCLHLCRYCYANSNKNMVMQNVKRHNDNSPFLIGGNQQGDIVKEAKQESYVVKDIL